MVKLETVQHAKVATMFMYETRQKEHYLAGMPPKMPVPIFFQKGIDGDAGWRAACGENHIHLSYRLRP